MSSCAWLRYQHPQAAFCTASALNQSHYDVLGIKNDCTLAEVKDQYIRLSKEFHPDTNPESKDNKRILAINEAYSVLSKPGLRKAYDTELLQKSKVTMHTYGDIRTNAPMEQVIFKDDSLWEHRDKTEFYKNRDRPYYGVKGVKKMPNSYIAAGAVVFMIVGAVFHFFLAKTSSDFTIKQLNLRDQIASTHHTEVRNLAKANGNAVQMELLRRRNEEEIRNR